MSPLNVLSGDILDSEFVVYVPDTWKVENEHSSSKSKKIIKDTQYFYKAKNLTVYKNAIYQGGIAYVSENAPYSVKFNFDKPVLKKSLLILEGMGTSEIELIIRNSKHIISVHPYRENVIDLNEYISSEYRGEFIINFYRFSDVYISKEYSSQNKDIVIDFQNPKLFQPQELVIEKK